MQTKSQNMKKIIVITALIGMFSISSAFAKTEGSYLGLDLIGSSIVEKTKSDSISDSSYSKYYNYNKSDFGYGVGLNYKYAFNFDKFFVAPGVSFNLLTNEVKASYATSSTDGFSQRMKLQNQITFQTNFGYDVTDRFAAYIPVGISSFGYEMETYDYSGLTRISAKKTDRESAMFIGLGFAYQPTKNWVMSLEYNKFQNLKMVSSAATTNNGKIVADVGVEMVKLGVAYKF